MSTPKPWGELATIAEENAVRGLFLPALPTSEMLQNRLEFYNSQRGLFVSDLGILYIRNILQGETAAATHMLSIDS